jgi:hypothetical protein
VQDTLGCAPMKDVHTVLRQKELDVERVRKEIQSLYMVIPLLADEETSFMQLLLESAPTMMDPPAHNCMAELETYYPFVRNLGAQGRLG